MKKILSTIKENFKGPTMAKELRSFIAELAPEDRQGYYFHQAEKIPIKWTTNALFELRTYHNTELDILEVIEAAKDHLFLSHYSALYFNELATQTPTEHFVSKEVNRTNPPTKGELNEELMKNAFMKSPRHTKHSLIYDEKIVLIIEKIKMDYRGVISKKVSISNRSLNLKMTCVERTLIDCIMSPHYAGGILNVTDSFKKAESIDLNFLFDIYKRYNPIYPYWQSIGFVLEKTRGKSVAYEWGSKFKKKKIDFYLDKKYRTDWFYDEFWKIHFPKEIA